MSGAVTPIRLPNPPATLGRIGALEVRLAERKREVKRAQKLRYRVFYQDGTAIADAATLLARRDKDAFDRICDHLHGDRSCRQALDRRQAAGGRHLPPAAPGRGGAAWRLLQPRTSSTSAGLIDRHSDLRFLELGRSCVLPRYRTRRTVELLWHGIWTYVRQHRLDVMIGCASFEGTDPDRLALPLSFLHHYAQAPEAWRAAAHSSRRSR